jgi:hypothetical protein
MAGSKRYRAKLIVLILLIVLDMVGCSGQESKEQPGSPLLQQETGQTNPEETDLQQTDKSVIEEETTERITEIFIEMLENHPLHRHGELSPDKRYYAYEERSSIILVQLPAPEEYQVDKTLLPKVLFIDGIRKGTIFTELEAEYAQRLKQPLLTEEELNEARNQLRSVYDWKNFYSQKFSQDGRYLAYLGYSNFGNDRTCTVYVLDLKDNCKLYSLPVKENSEHAGINWQEDNQTLELYLPHAAVLEGKSLALCRRWHIPSGLSKLTYYNEDGGTEDRQEIAPAEAQKFITEYTQTEAERSRGEEKWAKLTVEQLVAALTAEELAAEYTRYYTLHGEQKRELQERGYSDESIAEMDSFDFQQEESKWLISEKLAYGAKRIYPELKDQDLSSWTHQKYNEYVQEKSKEHNAPPTELKQEITARGLPEDINSGVAKEFHGWENMLAYTNEAIIAMYEARQESEAIFRKGEAYRLAVRKAYLEKNN